MKPLYVEAGKGEGVGMVIGSVTLGLGWQESQE